MKQGLKTQRSVDISSLPTHGFGSSMTMWWGSLGFMALETMGFALAIGTYLYLAVVSPAWPPGVPQPDLFWSTILTLALVGSLVPNHVALSCARSEDLPRVRLYLVVMSLLGIAPLILRAFEFTTLNVRWDQNAYGSIIWLILGLHTTHLVTDVVDTLVLTTLMFTRHAHGKRFSDVEDNAIYWDFVVLSWIPVYLLLYWFPRL